MSGEQKLKGQSGASSRRRDRADESFKNASECIGPIHRGMSMFAITRGQFSMIDAILHTLRSVGPASISLWTWIVADHDINIFERMMVEKSLTGATLIVDQTARDKNRPLLQRWVDNFGIESIRFVSNHAKMATVAAASGERVLLRGSMNLNFNPRFEQLDVTEGGPDYDLVKKIESELKVLPMTCTGREIYANSQVSAKFNPKTLPLFREVKTWSK